MYKKLNNYIQTLDNSQKIKIAIYDKRLNDISYYMYNKIINNLHDLNNTDINISINKEKYILEFASVQFENDITEVDLMLLKENEYISRYGENK